MATTIYSLSARDSWRVFQRVCSNAGRTVCAPPPGVHWSNETDLVCSDTDGGESLVRQAMAELNIPPHVEAAIFPLSDQAEHVPWSQRVAENPLVGTLARLFGFICGFFPQS